MKFRKILPLFAILIPIFALSLSAKTVITDEILTKINSDGDETSLTISPERNTIIFTRKNRGENNFNLYITTYKDGSWEDPVLMEGLNSESDDISPFLANDGKKLLFASNRELSLKESNGETHSYDIYYSVIENGTWTKPVQLFGAVNTREDEINPFITENGKTLYFTRINSRNPENIKIIKVNQADDFWSDVKTAPISNQSEIKPFFVRPSLSGESFYFSAYIDSIEKKDIYLSRVNQDGETEILIAGEGVNTGDDEIFASPLDSKRMIISTNHGEKGSYNFIIVPAPENISEAYSEDKIDAITNKSIYFNFNSSAIKLDYIPRIHSILKILRNNEDLKLTIHGYADGIGSHKANIDISLKRAETVKEYLVNMGISRDKIHTLGHGYVKTELKHTAQQHRKVDFEFIK